MPSAPAIVALLALVATATSAQSSSRLGTPQTYNLTLSPSMSAVVQSHIPDFQLWTLGAYDPDIARYYVFSPHQAPWAVFGDFNGDSTADAVLEGHDGKSAYRICLLSVPGDTGYQYLMLKREQIAHPGTKLNVLLFQPPARFRSAFGEPNLDLRTDGFQDEIFDKASTLYYWRDGAFHEFASAD